MDCSFDLIINRNVTHTLQNHMQAYQEWHRLLRPGGKVMIFDANWHLMQTDDTIHHQFLRREEECFLKYGSNFSADGKREGAEAANPSAHRLGVNIRPDWDLPLLEQAGFNNICVKTDLIDALWDEKEKLLYGATPLFMIAAGKSLNK